MIKPDYTFIIPLKIYNIISLLIENKKLSFLESLKYLYNSKLYEFLSNEETKIWHLSPHKLLDILVEEKQNNNFELPDFV